MTSTLGLPFRTIRNGINPAFLCDQWRLTTRWKRPGRRRDLAAKLYDGEAGKASDGPIPGASAQNR